jgi:hypothetical protein
MVKALEGVAGDISIRGAYLQHFSFGASPYVHPSIAGMNAVGTKRLNRKNERERGTVGFPWVFNLAARIPLQPLKEESTI